MTSSEVRMLVTSCCSFSKRSRSKGSFVKVSPFWAIAWTCRAHCRTFMSTRLQVRDQCITEGAGRDLPGPFHQAGEVVGHDFLTDGAVHCVDDRIGRLGPAHVAEHHFARQN